MTRAITLITGLLAFILASIAAQAQDHGQYQVLIDADDNPASGCSIQPSGGGVLSGYEARLIATVDFGALEVIHVERQTCPDGAFAATDSSSGRYPVALNAGVSGSDSIELAAGRDALGLGQAPNIELAFVSDNAEGSDVITTTSGTAGGGGPISLGLPIQVPALSPWALAGLVIALIGLAWLAHRRLGRVGTICVVMGVATLTWAMQFAADGDLSDWSGHSPAATDPPGDATDGRATADLLAAFAAVENDILYFRLDVVDLENRPPEANNDSYTVEEDSVLDVSAPGALGNDNDADDDSLTAILETGPDNAAGFTLNADGSFSYEPEPDFNGENAFTYRASDGDLESDPATVIITVDAANDPPEADDSTATTEEDVAVTIELTGSDVDGDVLDFATVDAPDNGSLGGPTSTGDTTAEVSYTPDVDFNGTDSFSFTTDDGSATSDPATLTITVDPVNDPPVANADTAAIIEQAPNTSNDNTVNGNVLANDTDPDSSAISVSSVEGAGGNVGNPAASDYGSVTIDADGSYTYVLDDGNAAVDGLAPGETLTDSISYSAWDGSLADSTSLTVTIDGADDQAVAVDDAYSGIENTDCLLTTILDNDIDPDGGNLVAFISLPSVGSLHLVGEDGSAGASVLSYQGKEENLYDATEFCFVPEPFDYSHPDTEPYTDFEYMLLPGESSATVELFIEPAPESNAAPTADSQSLHAGEITDNKSRSPAATPTGTR